MNVRLLIKSQKSDLNHRQTCTLQHSSGASALTLALSDHGNDGTVGPGTVGSASTARRGAEADNGSPASIDPRVMNKCPIFSGRDTEWSEWSFIFECVAGMANLEPAMKGAFKRLAEKPLADLSSEMKLSAKQLCSLLVNTVRCKALTLVRNAEKHHGIAACKNASSQSTSQTQLDDILRCSWESCSLAGTLAARRTRSWIN